jgi:hypothetical protein
MAMKVDVFARFLAAALAAVALHSGAAEDPRNVLFRLGQSLEVSCKPNYPVFCGNVHVSCAGPTSIPAFAFSLSVANGRGAIVTPPEAQSFREQYEGSRAEWDADAQYVILWPNQTNGYIKLFSGGQYVFRHYAPREAVMSLGRCE